MLALLWVESFLEFFLEGTVLYDVFELSHISVVVKQRTKY